MTDIATRRDEPGLKEKIGYALGDLGFNLYWANISAFLLIFYTDVMGLAAAAAGTMLLVTKIVDAITDPLMGALSDRTRTRWGRYRPWLVWAAIPMAVAGVLTWTVPDFGPGGKLIWAYATFTVMMLFYTVLNIPYSALSGVITGDSRRRTTLISLRFIAAFAGTTLVNTFTLPLVDMFGRGDEPLGWQMTLGLYGVIAAVIFTIVFATTKERVQPIAAAPAPVRQDIADLLGNRPWLVLFALALIIMVTIVMRGGSIVYYLKYFVQRPDLTPLFLGCYSIALAVGAASTPIMLRFIDKKRLMMLLMAIAGVLSCLMAFVPPDAVWVMFGMNLLIGLALGPKSPLAFSMYADCADYTEWKTGRRATALTFAAAAFSQKLGGALASAVIAWVLAAMGYVANQAQSDASQFGIVLVLTVIPGVIALIAAATMLAYPLNDRKLAEIQADLDQRRGAVG